VSILHLPIDANKFRMDEKKKKEPAKSLEQLLEETKTQKEILLKILEKITKENPEDQTPN